MATVGTPARQPLINAFNAANIDSVLANAGRAGAPSLWDNVSGAADAVRFPAAVTSGLGLTQKKRVKYGKEPVADQIATLAAYRAEIETLARDEGCGVVRDFGGHGIGQRMHMPPHVDHHGPAGRGPRLRPGMTFTIEPMITLGHPALRILEDGWTVVTVDGSPSAQFEHTVAVTEDGCEVLTQP